MIRRLTPKKTTTEDCRREEEAEEDEATAGGREEKELRYAILDPKISCHDIRRPFARPVSPCTEAYVITYAFTRHAKSIVTEANYTNGSNMEKLADNRTADLDRSESVEILYKLGWHII